MDMDIHRNGLEMKLMEFWPVEHPVEPMEEDRPIECPKIPHTSAMNVSKLFYFIFPPLFSSILL